MTEQAYSTKYMMLQPTSVGDKFKAQEPRKYPKTSTLKKLFTIDRTCNAGIYANKTGTWNVVSARRFREGFAIPPCKHTGNKLLWCDKLVWKMINGKTLPVIGHLDGDIYNNDIANLYDPNKLTGKKLEAARESYIHKTLPIRFAKLLAWCESLSDEQAKINRRFDDFDVYRLNRDLDIKNEVAREVRSGIRRAVLRELKSLTQEHTSAVVDNKKTVTETMTTDNYYLWPVLEMGEKVKIVAVDDEFPGVDETRYILEWNGHRITGVDKRDRCRTDTGEVITFPARGWLQRTSALNFVRMVQQYSRPARRISESPV